MQFFFWSIPVVSGKHPFLFPNFSKIILLQVGYIMFSVSSLKGYVWCFAGNAPGMFWRRNKVSCTFMWFWVSVCIYVILTHLLFLRLYTCMLTLQLSKPLDVCTVSTAIAFLWKNVTNVSFDGSLSRIGKCWTVCTVIPHLQLIQVVQNIIQIFFSLSLYYTAICRLPTDSETIPLNSTFTWLSVNLSASQNDEIKDILRW